MNTPPLPVQDRHSRTRRFGLFLTALSVAAVLYLTLYPFTFGLHYLHRAHRMGGVDAVLPSDVVANMLLFVPVGIGVAAWAWGSGVRGWPLYVLVQCFCTLLSLGVENLQVFLPRQPSVVDIITNTLGALLGYAFFRLWAFAQRTDDPEEA
ncbi:MAG TPA: VanZ family protein [Rhodothermales bacterium]|nr:VanZ family protein [Rhodothermales bacterium]